MHRPNRLVDAYRLRHRNTARQSSAALLFSLDTENFPLRSCSGPLQSDPSLSAGRRKIDSLLAAASGKKRKLCIHNGEDRNGYHCAIDSCFHILPDCAGTGIFAVDFCRLFVVSDIPAKIVLQRSATSGTIDLPFQNEVSL